MHDRAFRTRRTRSAFTLLEVIIVVVLIALMATMILPRFGGAKKREFNLVVDSVADLMTMFAQRESLSQQTVGIRFDTGSRAIELVRLQKGADGERNNWVVDTWVDPVRLPYDVELVDVRADGDYIDIADWPLATTPLDRRPSISLTLRAEAGPAATLTLSPHSTGPTIADDRNRGAFQVTPEDLDRAGRSRQAW